MDKKPKKTFTPTQQTAIDLLKAGAELSVSTDHTSSTPRIRYRIQEGGAGRGGATHKVTKVTLDALREYRVVKKVERKVFPFDAVYEIDRDGLAALGHTSGTDGA